MKICYVLQEGANATSDIFHFVVEDGGKYPILLVVKHRRGTFLGCSYKEFLTGIMLSLCKFMQNKFGICYRKFSQSYPVMTIDKCSSCIIFVLWFVRRERERDLYK